MTGDLRVRLVALGAVLVVAIAASVFAVLHAVAKDPATARERPAPAEVAEARRALPSGPRLVFRSTAPKSYGLVSMLSLGKLGENPVTTDLECERVYAVASAGLCLSADRGVVTTYHARLLDGQARPGREVTLAGIPSRARVSPDGRYAAATTFVSGHSYSPGTFSTATTLYDVESGRELANLEKWRIVKDGRTYRAVDVNVWGVSFTPDSRGFYVTVASKGNTWLSRGDIATKTITTMDVQAECPSVSPDGSKVAFKRTTGRAADWRIWVLDVASGRVHQLGGDESVDDQVEWLDEEHLVYGLERDGSAAADLWSAPVDGGTPQLLLKNAWSPAVIR